MRDQQKESSFAKKDHTKGGRVSLSLTKTRGFMNSYLHRLRYVVSGV